MKTFNRKSLKPKRKELRNNPTFAEVLLWKELKHRKLGGKKFRRQESIGNYIVDFYCHNEKLVIELDGETHFTDEGRIYDAKRTKYLKSKGLEVIRFENNEVLGNISGVLEEIKKSFGNK